MSKQCGNCEWWEDPYGIHQTTWELGICVHPDSNRPANRRSRCSDDVCALYLRDPEPKVFSE